MLVASGWSRSILVRKNVIHDIKGDKRSIGDRDFEKEPFTLQRFKLNNRDALYLLSDGYADQFGGDDDEKLMVSGTRGIP